MKLLLLLCIFCAFFPSVQLDAAWKMMTVERNGKKYVSLADAAKKYGFKLHIYPASGKNLKFAIYNRDHYAILTENKRQAVLSRFSTVLNFPPIVYKKIPMISEMDLRKTIFPVFYPASVPKKKIKVIMLDAGHGGKDTGAPGPGGKWEKAVTLSLSAKLRTKLQRMGYRVLITRTADVFPTLEQRMQIAARWKPDLYISLHCNAASDHSISGIETFSVTPAGAPSSGDSKVGCNITEGNRHDAANMRLAYEIHKGLLKSTGAPDRGIKHARFYVIKNVNAPAVLVEAGFLSNAAEGRKLITNAYQDKVVSGIADGIASFSKISGR